VLGQDRHPHPEQLTLGDPFGVSGVAPEQVILDAALASRADNDDTIDLAVLAGVTDAKALRGYHVVHFQPFDPVHKRTEATVKATGGKTFRVSKGGAPGDPRAGRQLTPGQGRRRQGGQ